MRTPTTDEHSPSRPVDRHQCISVERGRTPCVELERSSNPELLLLSSVQNERTQSLPRRPIDRGLYAGLCTHHHWLGDYWRPATALDESARRSHRRKMTGPH